MNTPLGRRLETDEELSAVVQSMETVTVLGAKGEDRPSEPAYSIPHMLATRGYRVARVNPSLATIDGEPAYKALAEVPVGADVLDVFRRPAAIPDHVDEILALPAERRPKVVWLQSGIRHDEATARLLEVGIDVVQDACLGVLVSRYGRRS